MGRMETIDVLLAMEGVKRCKAEYFRCIDGQHWDDLTANFTSDAEIDMRESVQPHNPDLLYGDPGTFTAGLAPVLTDVTTAHFGYMPQIDILSPGEACAVWSMEDWLWVPDGHQALPSGRMHGWGHYHERYTKVGDRWLIAATRLTRIKLEYS